MVNTKQIKQKIRHYATATVRKTKTMENKEQKLMKHLKARKANAYKLYQKTHKQQYLDDWLYCSGIIKGVEYYKQFCK